MEKDFSKILSKMLATYEHNPGISIAELVKLVLKDDEFKNIDAELITCLAEKIAELFDEFGDNLQSLETAKKEFHSRNHWIKQKLRTINPNWGKAELDSLVGEFNRQFVAHEISLSAKMEANPVQAVPASESQILTQYIQGDLGRAYDKKVKTVVATAFAIAKAKDTPLPKDEKGLTEEAFRNAALADEGLSRLKLAYKVASESLKPEDVSEHLCDWAAVRYVSAARAFVKFNVSLVAGAIAALVFPKSTTLSILVSSLLPLFITDKVTNKITIGICKMGKWTQKIREEYKKQHPVNFEELTKR